MATENNEKIEFNKLSYPIRFIDKETRFTVVPFLFLGLAGSLFITILVIIRTINGEYPTPPGIISSICLLYISFYIFQFTYSQA